MRQIKRFKSEGPPQTGGLDAEFSGKEKQIFTSSNKLTKSKSIAEQISKRPPRMKTTLDVNDVLGSLYIQKPNENKNFSHQNSNYYLEGIEKRVSLYLQSKLNNMICEVTKEITDLIETNDPFETVVDSFLKVLLDDVRYEIKLTADAIKISMDGSINEFQGLIKTAKRTEKEMKMKRYVDINDDYRVLIDKTKEFNTIIERGSLKLNHAIESLEKRRAKIKEIQKSFNRKNHHLHNKCINLELEKSNLNAEIDLISSRRELLEDEIESFSYIKENILEESLDSRKRMFTEIDELLNFLRKELDEQRSKVVEYDNQPLREQIAKMQDDFLYDFRCINQGH